VNLVKSSGENLYNASLLVFGSLLLMLTAFYARVFALKAQDRAIRAEENFRHYVLTGKMLDSKLTARQIIGLRFAPDEEYADLASRAVTENLSENAIKKSIKNWKEDLTSMVNDMLFNKIKSFTFSKFWLRGIKRNCKRFFQRGFIHTFISIFNILKSSIDSFYTFFLISTHLFFHFAYFSEYIWVSWKRFFFNECT
jgi:hypothetical protein